MPFATAHDGTRIHYDRQHPAGPPASSRPVLLAIAPLGMTARLWDLAVPVALAHGYSTISVDNRGSGRSGSPRRPWSTGTMADDAIAVLDREGVKRAHVCGPSLGGMVVQEIALRHPGRVGAVVLAATTAGLPRLDLMPVRIVPRLLGEMLRRDLASATPAERVRTFLRVSVSAEVAARVQPTDPLWGLVQGVLDERVPPAGQLRQVLAGALHAAWTRLPSIAAPTLVLHGTADPVVPFRAGQEIARRVAGARLEALEGAGHVLIMERPDAVTITVMRFLAEHDALLA